MLIIACSIDEALERLNHVLEVLLNTGFFINLKKCSFVVEKVKYLGYEVEKGEIRPNSTKIDALIKLPPPSTVRQLQSFLGLASYFRQFIPWHTIHLDATGKISGKCDLKEYLFVTIDAFSKYCLLKHTKKNSLSAIKALREAIHLFSSPARIICDQGRCYTSKEFKDFCFTN